jgi:hypothetical protein
MAVFALGIRIGKVSETELVENMSTIVTASNLEAGLG